MKHLFLFAFIWIPLLSIGCNSTDSESTTAVSRELLDNGATLLRYAELPPEKTLAVDIDLKIGSENAEPEYLFGDIRGVDASQDGNIFVLDFQASEIRAFDKEGRFLRTVATRGVGPGEIDQANGMILVADSVIWVQDHGQWKMKGFSPSGGELVIYPMPIYSFGFIWDGTVDNAGRVWKIISRRDPPPSYPLDPGLNTGQWDNFFVRYDYRTQERDSVFIGVIPSQSYVLRLGRGSNVFGIPYQATTKTIVDPEGGFWKVRTDEYRIARMNEAGDTTLVIEVGIAPVRITQDLLREFKTEFSGFYPNHPGLADEIISYMPDFMPLVESVSVDDQGHLWVLRLEGVEEEPHFDVFDRKGAYQGSVRLETSIVPRMPVRVRNNRLYALKIDSTGAPSIVRSSPINFDW